ncbi:hypothetical protein HD554DRAFT_2021531 [Boletus coccyginus]|nr:hypothetical protein HD554DRAFT_2021531 [Boletus coccyginus]
MPGGSPTAYLLWSILSTLVSPVAPSLSSLLTPKKFFSFHLAHLWSYDRFQCLKWNQSGRQPGAFKRFMSYTYLATLSCLVCFSVAFTFLKFQEGALPGPSRHPSLTLTPVPLEYYSSQNKKWVLPLLLVFSVGWACTLFALMGMPLTTFISRRQLDSCLAWTLLVGSSASTATSLAFLYVLSRFPAFIRRVQEDSAAPNVVLRLVFFYQLNVGRIIYRFLFSLPLFVLSLDGVQGSHAINNSTFWPDFLLMIGGIGAFVSSAITLLIFFPRSLTQELGYTVTAVKSPDARSIDLNRPPVAFNQRPASPKDQVIPIFRSSSSEHHSSHSGHYASPEYDPEDLSNAAHPDSLEGNIRMHAWHPHEVETPSSEPYVFDRRSRGLVRSQSEGHSTALHPYVRHFLPLTISVLIAVPINSFEYSSHP